MSLLSSPLAARDCTDSELVARLPGLVQAERHAMADVIEHLVEMERRKLYLSHSVSSLYRYCIDRLGYDEDAALKRHRVAKLALRLPQVLDELRSGALHLSGLFLLAKHLTDYNASALLGEARCKSRRQIEELIARWFPRPDVPPSIHPLTDLDAEPTRAGQLALVGTLSGTGGASRTTCSGAGRGAQGRLEPLSPSRVRVEFTARAELYEKLEKARGLLSHALPSGELGELFERALDALLEQETRKRFGAASRRATRKRSRAKAQHEAHETSKRFGAQTPRETSKRFGAQTPRETSKRSGAQTPRETSERFGADAPREAREARKREPRSRHVPVRVARAVWQRDRSQCTHVDAEGRRCGERRFLTIEHRTPFALGGPHTTDNLCLLCAAHNLASARRVFGDSLIEARIRTRAQEQEPTPPRHDRAAAQPPPLDLDAAAKLQAALCQLGFRRSDAAAAVGHALGDGRELDVEHLLRKCLALLVPVAS